MRIDPQTFNRLAVLKAIRRNGPVSRVELAKLTGLAGATITEITAGLMAMGLLFEQKQKPDGRGRPRAELSVNRSAGIALAVNIEPGVALVASFVDLEGNLLSSSTAPLQQHEDLTSLAHGLADDIFQIVCESGFQSAKIMRVGLSLPAVVDRRNGVVRWIPMYPPGEVPFAAIITARLGCPVTVENDVDCFARAHHWFSAAPVDSFLLVHAGLGIGAAHFRDGVPTVGANGFNVELAHVKITADNDARPCICGARGCLVTTASIFGMLKSSSKILSVEERTIADIRREFGELMALAKSGDADAVRIFEQAGRHIGLAIANQVNVLDPGVVLFQTSDPDLEALLKGPLEAAFHDSCFQLLRDRTSIRIDQVIEGWRWKGAAALALEQIYLSE